MMNESLCAWKRLDIKIRIIINVNWMESVLLIPYAPTRQFK